MTAFSELDEQHMQAALRIAEKGRGMTRPNPVVGAVITRQNKPIAQGFHRRAGQAHAEIDALARLGMRAPGCTLYVTLEPCAHTGRTGPCTKAVVAAGFRRVVVGCRDENPKVSGRGIATLRRAGLQVDVGCMEEKCRQANAAFFRWITAHRPFITLKAAATLDGYIGDGREKHRPPNTRWITGPKARQHAHKLRAQNDAILVGIGTIFADNPSLTARVPGRKASSLLRIVLDSHLRIDPCATIFQTPNAVPPLIVASEPVIRDPSFSRRKNRIEALGAEVILLPADHQGRPALTDLLSWLASREIQGLLVEGGSTIHGAFIAEGLVDQVVLYLAPRLVGRGIPIAKGQGPGWLHPLELSPLTMTPLGKDWVVSGQVRRHNQPVRK